MAALQVQLHSTGPIALDAQFDCQPGELLALLGPSGSGKTTLLRAVAGLLPRAGLQGTVQLGGSLWFGSAQGICLAPQQRRVGLVFQSYALFPHMNAMENIAVCACPTGVNGQKDPEIVAYVHGLMLRLGLDGLAQRLPAQLSGGQQQRVALARALMRLRTAPGAAAEHGVLLLDEPFSAVDAPTRQTLYRELAELRRHVSTPMVLVTHDLMEARRLADRVVVVDGGTSLQMGTPTKVFGQPRNARVAQLVGIQNLFTGRFHRAGGGWGQLHWLSAGQASEAAGSDAVAAGVAMRSAALVLHTPDKGRIDDGAQVRWVVAGESMELHPWRADAAGSGDDLHANLLECVVEEVLALGETSLCTLRPMGLAAERITLTQSTVQLRALGIPVGGRALLHIAPQGIHIMPVRA